MIKYCPLAHPHKCIEENCAWWDKDRSQCFVLALAPRLVEFVKTDIPLQSRKTEGTND